MAKPGLAPELRIEVLKIAERLVSIQARHVAESATLEAMLDHAARIEAWLLRDVPALAVAAKASPEPERRAARGHAAALTDALRAVRDLIAKSGRSGVPVKFICAKLGLNDDAAFNRVRRLRDMGIVERVGAKTKARWRLRVVDDGESDAARITEYIAAHGVTACPPAHADNRAGVFGDGFDQGLTVKPRALVGMQ